MTVAPLSLTADRSGLVVGVHAGMIALSTLSVFVRIYTRARIVKWVGVDDIFICCALLLATLEAAAAIAGVKYGLGRHTALQPPEAVEPYTKTMLVSFAAYTAAIMFVKLSLLSFYLRLSPEKTFRTVVYIMMVVSVGLGIGSIMTIALQCLPISMLWDDSLQGTCIDITVFYYANAGINIATDLIIYSIPISTLWRLKMPTLQKIGLCSIFCLGALAVVASIYRITVLHYLLFSMDQCWHVVNPLIWSTIELHVAIFATSIPVFKPLLRHHLPNLMDASRKEPTRRIDPSSVARKHNSAYLSPPLAFQHPSRYPLSAVIFHDASQHGTQTTIKSTDGFRCKQNNESEEFIVVPQQGIMAHTSVRVEHEEVVTTERSSTSSTLDGKSGFS